MCNVFTSDDIHSLLLDIHYLILIYLAHRLDGTGSGDGDLGLGLWFVSFCIRPEL